MAAAVCPLLAPFPVPCCQQLPAHLAVVALLDGQDFISDALTHVTLATAPSRRQGQQHQAGQLWAGLIDLRARKGRRRHSQA
jgi:hypothetical protein